MPAAQIVHVGQLHIRLRQQKVANFVQIALVVSVVVVVVMVAIIARRHAGRTLLITVGDVDHKTIVTLCFWVLLVAPAILVPTQSHARIIVADSLCSRGRRVEKE